MRSVPCFNEVDYNETVLDPVSPDITPDNFPLQSIQYARNHVHLINELVKNYNNGESTDVKNIVS